MFINIRDLGGVSMADYSFRVLPLTPPPTDTIKEAELLTSMSIRVQQDLIQELKRDRRI